MANEMELLAESVFKSMQGYMADRFKTMEANLREFVRSSVAEIPMPKDGLHGKDGAPGIDGKSGVDGKDGSPGRDGSDGKDGSPGVDGKDGSNGIDGKDGAIGLNGKDGVDGREADADAIAAKAIDVVVKFLDEVPLPKDGAPGAAGRDGVDGKDGLNGKDGAQGSSGKDGSDGSNGKDGAEGLNGKDGVDGINAKDGAPGRDGKDGSDGLVGKDGANGRDGVDGSDGTDGQKGADGINGKDYDPTVLKAEVVLAVKTAVAEIPPAQAGRDANEAAIASEVFDRVMKSIRLPADGKSVTIDEVKPLLEGEVSRWELDFERRAADVLQRAVDRLPRPKDGKDGFSLEDIDLEARDGGRFILVKFKNAGHEKVCEVQTKLTLDRGVWKSGDEYQAGDGVTYGNSYWFAQVATKESPSDSRDGTPWRMAIRRPKDGKDAGSV